MLQNLLSIDTESDLEGLENSKQNLHKSEIDEAAIIPASSAKSLAGYCRVWQTLSRVWWGFITNRSSKSIRVIKTNPHFHPWKHNNIHNSQIMFMN